MSELRTCATSPPRIATKEHRRCYNGGYVRGRRRLRVVLPEFGSYFPYNAKLCVNGHEYLKGQLAKRGVAFEALDNGVPSCADPALMQRLAEGLTAARIDALVLRGWRGCRIRLPPPTERRTSATTSPSSRRSSR